MNPSGVISIEPLDRPPHATVSVPGSKSLTNRALVCAALADGESPIEGMLVADDSEAMVGALRAIGAEIGFRGDDRDAARVRGIGGVIPSGPLTIDCRSAATVARFLTPVLAAGRGPYLIDGSAQMRLRPMKPVIDGIGQLGARVTNRGVDGRLPIEVVGPAHGGRARLPADVSSQFLSGLLLAGPLMPDGVVVEPTTDLVAEPFVAMTRRVMADFGVTVDGLTVAPQRYQPTDYRVEPDSSAASYFFAAAALTGGRITVRGLHLDSVQGDIGFVEILAAMGTSAEDTELGVEVQGTGELRGGEFDLRATPDLAPTLAVCAAFAEGDTTVTGIGFARHHETDRLAAIVTELRRCGIEADELADGFVVRPGPVRPARIETYGDHRMAMAFSLLGLRAPGIEILGPECVAKTFPRFFTVVDGLRR